MRPDAILDDGEADLVHRARRGDRDAFEELVRRTARLVHARVALEIGDPRGAEDLVQETYLVAWKSVHQVTDAAGFRAWLLAVAHSVCVDTFRRQARLKRAAPPRSSEGVLEGVPAPDASPDQDAALQETRAKVIAILRSLPEEYRMPLTLRHLGGLDYASISMQLGLTDGSLRGLLNRGMKLLREELKRALGSEVVGGAR